MSVNVKQAIQLSEDLYKACIPALRGQHGEKVMYAIYHLAAVVSYHGIGGLELPGGIRLNAPKHPPDGLMHEIALSTCQDAMTKMVMRIAPKNEGQN